MRHHLLSLDLSLISYKEALKEILELGRCNKPSYSCFANVHMLIEAHKSEKFAHEVNQANFVFTDGKPLCISLKILKNISQERVAGMDFMEDIIKECYQQNLSIFFFGSTEDVLSRIKFKLEYEFPGIKIAGIISPAFGNLESLGSYIDKINFSQPNIVFVALGCPKQEKWMAQNYSKINATLLGVGGAFPVFAGIAKRAPIWMQRFSLEWVFRLLQEPRRLLKRYVVTNSIFIFLILREIIRKRNVGL